MGKKLENVKKLYLEGIRKGQLEAVDMYTGDRYTQHSTGVRDGADGFKEFFMGFLKRTKIRDIQIIRGIEDGNYVFVHAYQDIDNGVAKWITTDLFDMDSEDKTIEHWDSIAAYKAPSETASGNDMVLGNFELKDLDKTEENKALIRNYIVDVFQNRDLNSLNKYISTEGLIQHNPLIDNGIDAFSEYITEHEVYYNFVFNVIGQGDHVVSLSKVTIDRKEHCVFDIYRIENSKIVEHWDNIEEISPREEWVNTGKF